MSSSLPFLQLLLFSTLVFYTSASLTIIDGICPKKMPQLAKVGDSCGIPPFVDSAVFGDNADTNGVMRVYPTKQGLDLSIIVKNLPKPNLVLTAWLIWTPFGVTTPKIFEVCILSTANVSLFVQKMFQVSNLMTVYIMTVSKILHIISVWIVGG